MSEPIVAWEVVGPFQENSYVLGCSQTQQAWVIDPGEAGPVLALLESKGLTATAIVNTHGHLDHITGVAELQEALELPFYLHPDDRELVETSPQHAALFGLPAPRLPRIDHDLADNQRMRCGELEVEIRHCPGHSPGHVVLRLVDHPIVINGDCLFQGSIGRTDLPGGSYPTLMNSIKTRILDLPDETVVYTGHGPPTTVGAERATNPFVLGLVT